MDGQKTHAIKIASVAVVTLILGFVLGGYGKFNPNKLVLMAYPDRNDMNVFEFHYPSHLVNGNLVKDDFAACRFKVDEIRHVYSKNAIYECGHKCHLDTELPFVVCKEIQTIE